MTTKSQGQVLKDAIRAALLNVNTAIPAKVTAVNVAGGKCDAEPVLKRKFASGEVVTLPVITNIPIAQLRAGKAFVSVPLHVGDYVLLIFSQRSMDLWLTSGGAVDPKDPRSHALSDAIAYPGVYPFSDPPIGASAEDLIVKNDQATITVKPSGEVKIEAPLKVEIITGDLNVQATGNVDVQAGGNVNVQATQANVQADQATVTATATIDMTAPAINANTPLFNVTGLIGCAGIGAGVPPVAGEGNFAGDLKATGNMEAGGNVKDLNGTMQEMRDTYNSHTHPENGAGGGTTSAPNEPMT